ncbi:UDP-glucuronosyltransferase 2A3-like isoform X1 [Arvicola amphibius]|uniref:UDP-glucuronosyltransferase 2A3-like isoform X1 n=1 Tax=Arvicola amphibius TaxID=1047088 RepID=UPI0018E3683F|nr:UDP-glucuronosyltransferase 2A3-like isoform X1 [Arvicola amphibius]
MVSEKWTVAVFLLQLCCVGCGFCGKVLVWPCDMSHWLNLKTILEELVQRGHGVTVLKFPGIIVDQIENSALNFENVPVLYGNETPEKFLNHFLHLAVDVIPNLSVWQAAKTLQDLFIQLTANFEEICRSALYNQTFMDKLRDAKYDVMLIDPIIPCGELVAEVLRVPFVNTLRFSMGSTIEKYCGQLPIPLSYVPVVMSELSDRMTFPERVKNMMLSLFFEFGLPQYDFAFWDQFYSETLGRPTTFCEIIGKAEIWLMRTYWDFEFPRPYLPNFEFVGGLHCKPAKPLPKEMEEFVQSSGEHGVVVFSLGSMVKNLTEDKANLIASALAQIPQKVLWRYSGKKPATLGSNTRLFNWIPQNDLLGHPKTKAFITHGGTNGIYEAIYHGIPMVGVPIFADQPDNIAHMKAKGAALNVNFNTMTSADLLSALRAVINEPSYKENAMRLSRIHHEQPVKPLDRAVFWIEFVMRHKGAKHLRVAAHNLNWFQYHSLDVIGFLLVCVVTLAFIITKCCLFTCRKLCTSEKKKRRNRKKKN